MIIGASGQRKRKGVAEESRIGSAGDLAFFVESQSLNAQQFTQGIQNKMNTKTPNGKSSSGTCLCGHYSVIKRIAITRTEFIVFNYTTYTRTFYYFKRLPQKSHNIFLDFMSKSN